jgi:hypothetical protein
MKLQKSCISESVPVKNAAAQGEERAAVRLGVGGVRKGTTGEVGRGGRGDMRGGGRGREARGSLREFAGAPSF